MKKVIIILITIPLIFGSCKKEDESPNHINDTSGSILGTWELISSSYIQTTRSSYIDPVFGTEIILNPGDNAHINNYTLDMEDSWGDGWNGNTLTAIGTTSGTVYGPFTLASGSSVTANFSSSDYCFEIVCDGGAYQSEVSWTLYSGETILTGGAPYYGNFGNCALLDTDYSSWTFRYDNTFVRIFNYLDSLGNPLWGDTIIDNYTKTGNILTIEPWSNQYNVDFIITTLNNSTLSIHGTYDLGESYWGDTTYVTEGYQEINFVKSTNGINGDIESLKKKGNSSMFISNTPNGMKRNINR